MQIPPEHFQLSTAVQRKMASAFALRQKHFSPVLTADRPGAGTLALSTTGRECGLDCAHCGGHYLEGMSPLDRAEDKLANGAYTSCLFSGGCTPAGKVEVAKQADLIRKLKSRGLKINMHAGLVSDEEIAVLAPLADKISFDLVVDDQTIRDVFGLSRRGEDYIAVYRKLRQAGAPVVPHLLIGLWGGVVRGEYQVIKALKELGADGLVFIVLIPTAGTRFADRLPPALENVADVMATARLTFPDLPLNLGCMRPGGRYRSELDQVAVRCGLNRIVNPTPACLKLAERMGLALDERKECCVL